MKLLLDTHVFLWYIAADPRLPATFRDAMQDSTNEVYLSAASVWEATVKYGLGKLPLPSPPADFFPQQRQVHNIQSLPVEEATMQYLAALPPFHRDPFDRILVAQAIQYGLTLASVDDAVRAYSITLLPLN